MRGARRPRALEARAEHPGARVLNDPSSPQVIGVDLGTTNSALASGGARGPVRVFDIPQVIAAGEVGTAPSLPSFLYLPTPSEIESRILTLPWDPAPDTSAGIFARDSGALVPARQVSSAKSWLSNSAVDRTAPLLPWIEDAERRLSPVAASARVLGHLRDAWNYTHRGDGDALRLERQFVVLTVPASFDEEARELTVQAARDAGLDGVTLLEEPLAALYSWIAAHPRSLRASLGDGALILVCDVGGGTTDFSLIRAAPDDGELAFERIAIGEHLLLGGDNLDLALAALVERKLPGGGERLSLSQRQTLRRKCSKAKEQLLSEGGPDALPITVLGAGRSVVAGGATVELTRAEVLETLGEGFLPLTAADDLPARYRRVALRELGLPYESEPAITRHLAAFLTHAAAAAGAALMARPSAVLFNGGFFTPAAARARILEALSAWSGTPPAVLENERPEASVAIGAAFYARLRRDPGRSRRLLIRAGSARAYYVGVAGDGGEVSAVCLLPRGTQEGTTLSIDRSFTVVANQPSAFTLYSTMARGDAVNALVAFSDDEDVYRHAPLVTALRFGKRSRRVPLAVRLTASFTESGTLELWCESTTTEHRWRLSFNLRGAEADPLNEDAEDQDRGGSVVGIPDAALVVAHGLVRSAFTESIDGPSPGALIGALENALGHGKQAWPLPALRSLADVLIDVQEGRRMSAAHEARWLNLVGFCTRPGIGAPLDPWRMSELRKVYLAGIVFARDTQCQVEWLVLWQRVAAGLTAGQQRELAPRVAGQLGIGQKKPARVNPQLDREGWRLLGSLERLDAGQRARLGDELVGRIERDPRNAARLWALGRIGGRLPSYGPLNTVVPAVHAVRWIERLLDLREISLDVAAAVVQLGALTGDPVRDLQPEVRDRAAARLSAAGVPAEALVPLREVVPIDPSTVGQAFGDPLPEGLRLEAGARR